MDGDIGEVSIRLGNLDEIRDMFGEQLQIEGFDENYCPTKQGRILESLIDKFYLGDVRIS